MLARLLCSASLCTVAAIALAGCGGSGSASSHHTTPAAVQTLVKQSISKSKIPTPGPTPTAFPASDFSATVAGVVTNHKTHSAIAGVTIVVGNRLRTTKTDAHGHYRVSFPAHAHVSLVAEKNGYAGALAIGKLPAKGSVTLNLQLTKNQPGVPPVPPMPMQFGSK